MAYDFLKPVLGDELFAQFDEKMKASEGITIANVSDGSFIPKAKFDEERNNGKAYKQQIEELNGKLTALQQAADGNEALKGQITQLQNDIAAKEDELKNQRLRYSIVDAVRKSKARNEDVVFRMIDQSKITENGGNLYGLSEQLEALKKSDPYLFESEHSPSGGYDPSHAPEGKGKSGNASINDAIRRAAGR